MNANKSSSHFSWEEWDNQIIVVLYRSDRRFVVKRYIERVLANSPQWKQFSFSNIDPIAHAYTMTEDEVKLIQQIFSWHLNGTLTFPIIAGLDQLLDWEDVLDFIKRAQENVRCNESTTKKSSSGIVTIPVGISSRKKSQNLEPKKSDLTPIKINKKVIVQQQEPDENTSLSSSSHHWIQINNICVPYIIKTPQLHLLPYQVLLDCNLFDDEERTLLFNFTIKATLNDIQTFEKIISSTSSINYKLNNDLLLIDLYHIIFGMSKVVYIKLLNDQRDVNKSYKTVLAQCGGTVVFRSHSIPFIRHGKLDYALLNSLLDILQPTTKMISILRRRVVPAQSHEIDYLRLVQFYQRKQYQEDRITINEEQLLLNINEVQKYINANDLVIDMLLTQYQQIEYKKMRKQIKITENKSTRKPTKRKASSTMTELQNTTTTTE